MKKYKKVTYTLEKSIVDVIHKRSLFENIPQSQLVSFYIQNGYSLMVDEYKDSGGKPIPSIRKRFGTVPKTFTLPNEVVEVINWFSDMMSVKRSHLVSALKVDFERELKKKEEERLSQQIDELMKLMDETYNIK